MDFLDQFIDEQERGFHLSAIHDLAQEFGVSDAEIRSLYENELENLYHEATIKDFLSIFVARFVRESYWKNGENAYFA